MTYGSVVEPLTASSTVDVFAAGPGDEGASHADPSAAHLQTGRLKDVRILLVEDVHADIPSLALTAYARPEDRERALRAGYQEHLTKPIDIPKLVAAISRWARRRQAT